MHGSIISAFALMAFLGFVRSESCKPDATFSDFCADGTKATPCCGNGPCNIFCSNCDNGCRTATYDGCAANVDKYFGPASPCVGCHGDLPVIHCITTDECQKWYDAAMASCKTKSGVSKRDAEVSWATNDTHADSTDGYEVFSLVDKDGNSNITFEEYVDYVHDGNLTLKENSTALTTWYTYFEKFDKNGDGVIDIDEHHRISDDKEG
ncbi:hypothetical protein IQ06DRAFT_307583 [Phaeosphaeriaceae sp. SRC1lsM3a]|nr:hypothetical protein IQ06DRAFT_307583 [Stagonospora sp. SRC1lsM3a]